jgi:hypothetical protein
LVFYFLNFLFFVPFNVSLQTSKLTTTNKEHNMKALVIGDIHASLSKVSQLPYKSVERVILLGDLLHGNNGALGEDVVDWFMKMGSKVELVLGNHEILPIICWKRGSKWSVKDVVKWDYGCRGEGKDDKIERIHGECIRDVVNLGDARMKWLASGKAKLIYGNKEFYHARKGNGMQVWEDEGNEWFGMAVKGELDIGGKEIWVGHENVKKWSKGEWKFKQRCNGVVTCLDWGVKKGGELGWEIIDM